MKVAYADPPYPGMALRHYSHDPRAAEVDHVSLIRRLNGEFPDGWMLSTGAVQMHYVLMCVLEAEGVEVPRPLPPWAEWAKLLPPGYRVGIWTKPLVFFKPGVNPAYSWEPVVWRGGRKRTRKQPTTYDYVVANAAFGKGLKGAKPPGFWRFVFETLNMGAGDEFHDLYPGTGGGERAWARWRTARQMSLDVGGDADHA